MTIYRSDVRDPLPGVKEWADTLDLTRRGLEFVGPCPLCGGDDRFHVRDSGGRPAVGCRGCIDGQPDGERAAIMEFDGGGSAWLLGVFLPLRGPSCFCGPVSQWDGALAGVERGG